MLDTIVFHGNLPFDLLMTGSISSPGLGSKLDVNAIVKALTAVEHKPIDILALHQKTVQTKVSSFGLMKNFMANLKDAAGALADTSLWKSTAASTTNAAVASVEAKSGAAAGSYRVRVANLAQAQTLVSAPTRDTKADLGAGSLRIEFGTWADGASAFTPQVGASAVTLALPASPSGLEAVRDRINAAKAGVTASILNDANGARLVVKSIATGAENGVRITASGENGDAAPPGLADLAYDPPSGATSTTRAQVALDANATVNGVPVTTASNVLDGVVEGLKISLHKTSTDDVDLEVSPDKTAMKKALTAFVSAYNDIASYIATQSKYDASTKTAAPLQGDATTLQLQRMLRGALTDSTGASTSLSRLLDAGIHLTADNTLALDSAKADKALADPQEMARAFANQDSGDSHNDGFGVRFNTLATRVLDFEGLLTQRSRALDATVSRSQSQQARMEDRVTQYSARLLKQYTALDSTMATISAQSSYVTQQMALLAKQSSG